jgi:hypothetical protein
MGLGLPMKTRCSPAGEGCAIPQAGNLFAGQKKRMTAERTESTTKVNLLFSANSVGSVVNLLLGCGPAALCQ